MRSYYLDLINTDGWSNISADKLLKAIDNSKNVKLENAINALGIEGVGVKASKDIAKNIKAMWEETKWNIRKVRQDAMSDTKKSFTAKEIWEDEHKANEANIDELTKKMNAKIDDLVKAKSEEVLKV